MSEIKRFSDKKKELQKPRENISDEKSFYDKLKETISARIKLVSHKDQLLPNIKSSSNESSIEKEKQEGEDKLEKGKNYQDHIHREDLIKDIKSELFKFLKEKISNELGRKKISNTKLGQMLNYNVRKSINNNREMRSSTFRKIENGIKNHLTEENKERALIILRDFEKNRGILRTKGRKHTTESKKKKLVKPIKVENVLQKRRKK